MKILNKKITTKFNIYSSIEDDYKNEINENTTIHSLIQRDIANIVHEYYMNKFKVDDTTAVTENTYFFENGYLFSGAEFLNKSYLFDKFALSNLYDRDSKVTFMVKLSEDDTRIKEIPLDEILSKDFKLEF